jgi:transposase
MALTGAEHEGAGVPREGDPWALLNAVTRERDALAQRCETLAAERDRERKDRETAEHEREQYRKLQELTVFELERLRRHLFGRRAEHVDPKQMQLVFEALRKELDAARDEAAEEDAQDAAKANDERKGKHDRKKRGPRAGRKLDLEHLPSERLEVPDARVLAEPERWVRIGEETSSKIEFRRASFVRLDIVRPIWARRDAVAEVAASVLIDEAGRTPSAPPEVPRSAALPPDALRASTPVQVVTPQGASVLSAAVRVETTTARVIVAPLPEHPLERCLAGPALLAQVIVSRFADHLPYHRLAKRYAREGVRLAVSTMCGWMEPCATLLGRIVEAMMADAITNAPWIGIDPTGVLVQQKEKCRRGHFWVMVAARDHVFFHYSPKQNGDVPKRLLKEYKGYVQADASSVYHALYALGETTEVGCWSHARRRYFDARTSDKERALLAIGFILKLYEIDDATKALGPSERTKERAARAGPVLEAFKRWLDAQSLGVLPRSPLGEAITYTLNHWVPLTRFVEDGRLRLDNNLSELELRSIAVGRSNWTFVGTDEYGEHAAVMVSLIASCRLHEINPETYLRDVLLLINSWPEKDVLQLAPKSWKQTRATLTDAQREILTSWPY